MKDETKALMAKAEEDLASAKYSLDGGFVRSCISSAYYAMFHAAQALLAEKGADSHSHQGLLATVSLEYIQSRLLPPEHGRHLHKAFERRMAADYDVRDHLPEETARETVVWAAAFIAAAQELLS